MPQYSWKDLKSGKEVDVIRTFSEYEVPPTSDEAPDCPDPEWVRIIGGKQAVVKGANWGQGKGSW